MEGSPSKPAECAGVTTSKLDLMMQRLNADHARYQKKVMSLMMNSTSSSPLRSLIHLSSSHCATDVSHNSNTGRSSGQESVYEEHVACGRSHTGVTSAPRAHRSQDHSLATATNLAAAKRKSATYWEERKLYMTAEELCLCLNGGVHYRALCAQYLHVMSALARMMSSALATAQEYEIFPLGTMTGIRSHLVHLAQEAMSLLAQHHIGAPPGLQKMAESPSTAAPTNEPSRPATAAPTTNEYTTPPVMTQTAAVASPSTSLVPTAPTTRRTSVRSTRRGSSLPHPFPTPVVTTHDAGASRTETSNSSSINHDRHTRLRADSPCTLCSDTREGDNVAAATAALLNDCPPCQRSGSGIQTAVTAEDAAHDALNSNSTMNVAQEGGVGAAMSAAHTEHVDRLSIMEEEEEPAPPTHSSHDVQTNNRIALRDLYAGAYQGHARAMLSDLLRLIFIHDYDAPSASGENVRRAGSVAADFAADVQHCVTDLVADGGTTNNALMYGDTAADAVYASACRTWQVQPRPDVCSVLRRFHHHHHHHHHMSTDEPPHTLNLSGWRLGSRHTAAVLAVVPHLSRLRHMDLGDNNLDEAVSAALCQALRYHPALQRVNASHNSALGGGGVRRRWRRRCGPCRT